MKKKFLSITLRTLQNLQLHYKKWNDKRFLIKIDIILFPTIGYLNGDSNADIQKWNSSNKLKCPDKKIFIYFMCDR